MWSLFLLLAACGGADDAPSWAFDPMFLEPDGTGVYGFQTWELYSERWAERPKAKFFVCSVLVELTGTPTTDCENCEVAWDVVPAVLESDCAPALVEDPLFVSLARVAIAGPAVVAEEGEEEVPYPGLTSHTLADYGYGWEEYGWAWPEALDAGGDAADRAWDDEQAFVLWPTLAWPVP